MNIDAIIGKPIEFEWDKGNINKNNKHGTSDEESEEVFQDENKFVFEDIRHSTKSEKRFGLFGITKNNKLLFIAFTMRKNRVRIISARRINRKEVLVYEKAINSTKI